MSQPIALNLVAVVAAVTDGQPRVLTVSTSEGDGPAGIPSGPLSHADNTLEWSLRRWVQDQAGIEVGYVEQLYTFADRGRGMT